MTWDHDLTVGSPYGDNRPPEDADPLRERLADTYREIADRARDLLAAEPRLPDSLTDETVGKITDYARQLKACAKRGDDARKTEKEPFLEAGRKVDGWFGTLTDPLKACVVRVETRVTAFLRAKEQAAREAREEEARRLAAEAREVSKAGDKAQAREIRREAADLRDEARLTSAADLVRTHTGMGGVATLKAPIAFEVLDKQKAVICLWRDIDDDALAKAIRANIRVGGTDLRAALENDRKHQPLDGVRLYVDRKASIR